MKKIRDQNYYRNSSNIYLTLGYMSIAGSAVSWFRPHGYKSFISGALVAIVMGILAIVQARKVDSPEKEKLKKHGIIEIVIAIIVPVVLLSATEIIVRKYGFDQATATLKATEEASVNDSDDETSSESVETAEPTYNSDDSYSYDDSETDAEEPTDERPAGSDYESIYNEYAAKIDKAAEDAINEYKTKSEGMSDEDKAQLADSLVEQILSVGSEGRDQITQLSIDSSDDSGDAQNWSEKLTDYSREKASAVYDLEYEANE